MEYYTVCGHEETREIEALGHEFVNEFTVDKEATTTEEGSKSQHCLHAGCTEKTNVTVIPKLTAGSEEVNPTPSTPDNKDDANGTRWQIHVQGLLFLLFLHVHILYIFHAFHPFLYMLLP